MRPFHMTALNHCLTHCSRRPFSADHGMRRHRVGYTVLQDHVASPSYQTSSRATVSGTAPAATHAIRRFASLATASGMLRLTAKPKPLRQITRGTLGMRDGRDAHPASPPAAISNTTLTGPLLMRNQKATMNLLSDNMQVAEMPGLAYITQNLRANVKCKTTMRNTWHDRWS